MVELIVGEKGKGKTKILLDKVNTEVKSITGNIVYFDRSSKHMYELNNKVRLIDVSDFFIDNSSEFLGFVTGVISQDSDLQQMYFDGFLPISKIELSELPLFVEKLEKISDKFGVDFIISVSRDKKDIPEILHSKISVAL